MKKNIAIVVGGLLLIALIVGAFVYTNKVDATEESSISYTPTTSSATLVYTDEYVDVYTVTTTIEIVTTTTTEGASSTSYYTEDETKTVRVSKTYDSHIYLDYNGIEHYYDGQHYTYSTPDAVY